MSQSVRRNLIDALRLDLVGPDEGLGNPQEVLAEPPSMFYFTGFLVPREAGEEQRGLFDASDDLDSAERLGATDDAQTPDKAAARSFLPSSIGLSCLVGAGTQELRVAIRWGDYRRVGGAEPAQVETAASAAPVWQRTARAEELTLPIPSVTGQGVPHRVPNSGGLNVVVSARLVTMPQVEGGLPAGTRSVSVFLVNQRFPSPDVTKDEAFVFQATLEVQADGEFVPRPNVHAIDRCDYDERIADLQYRDVCEFGVGHNVATEAIVEHDVCSRLMTVWIPQAAVERVASNDDPLAPMSMDLLAALPSGADARAQLTPLVTYYRGWISQQRTAGPTSPARRQEVAQSLLDKAQVAADRIEGGLRLLEQDAMAFEAFRLANKVMAEAGRRRLWITNQMPPDEVRPAWRPFQLAFLLMNLKGISRPLDADRSVVDLLFFPTGGGKTEAYLGLAAFTLLLRRMKNPGLASAGVSVLMRYTLRLLTLDQLSRAATLICALELERRQDEPKLGPWPFEIGLWVGKAATPNRMGEKNDQRDDTARAKTIQHYKNSKQASPIPLEDCPWCGTKFTRESFRLLPNSDRPLNLAVCCSHVDCAFTGDLHLPLVAVDEPLYRRLPCFLIATVDKFASLPWTGRTGALFGKVERFDREGFYGPCDPDIGQPLALRAPTAGSAADPMAGRLMPPDLIIQDELHLISGPLGTMAGLYESAIDELCRSEVDGNSVYPKIIASTATVRRAEAQIRALFNRQAVDVFPPPGPNRRDSFFAKTRSPSESPPRLYLAVAAQGRSPKATLLRVCVTLLAAAQKAWDEAGGASHPNNPADPYMTLLGYFNSLRELGGARRLIEDEVFSRLLQYGRRKRVGEVEGLFHNRTISSDPVELTSRIPTNLVAEAKRKLKEHFTHEDRVDVAIATNMISVGLDITRLGLMVVQGQPKTSAEYIQATSRVGRDHHRPGLVVTVLNTHRARDRSHYEQFCSYHQSFYRSVEATSVTPFSPRALDRGLAATVVALARLGHRPLTGAAAAGHIESERANLGFVSDLLASRAEGHQHSAEAHEIGERVRVRVERLLDVWARLAAQIREVGGSMHYQKYEEGGGDREMLLHDFLDSQLPLLPPDYMRFRANRSLRDVEPSANLWVKTMDGTFLEPEGTP